MRKSTKVKGKKPVLKSRKPVRRTKNQKYTSLMHGKRYRTKKPSKPYYDEFGFMYDKHGRIKGTYLDGFFYPD